MVSVTEAEKIIQSYVRDYGIEMVPFQKAKARAVAVAIRADRDFPPFNRVTMDGIGISFAAWENGIRSFKIRTTQAAGELPQAIEHEDECVEIMTGASLPENIDTIIPYEDIQIIASHAELTATEVKKGQNIHYKGKDAKQNEVLVPENYVVDAAAISIAASVGLTELAVKKLPSIVIVSTGNELVEPTKTPMAGQIRRSNVYAIEAALEQYGVKATLLHIPDDPKQIETNLTQCLKNYDVILLSGGVSMGKWDYLPQVLKSLSVHQLFHKVRQRPGKPFFFGVHQDAALVFAFPGNPVSTFMCLIRYFLPWLKGCLNINTYSSASAILSTDIEFIYPLQYFLQVKLSITSSGSLVATPMEGNGSGDFVNLVKADAFMELPLEENNFTRGQVFRIWPFRPLF